MARNTKEFYLSEDSLEWTKNHLQKFYDGDIFPKPFEFYAIWSDWQDIKTELQSLNLYKYNTGATRIMAVPKSSSGFRISHQLDPIDTIVYFSLIYYIVPQLEKYRFNFEEGISCSYRLKLENTGNLFDKENNNNAWKSFEDKTKEYSDSFEYILVADIADFYNSVYIHRVHNCICDSYSFFNETTEESNHVAKVLEIFLMSLTASSSKGIPVGPTPSIVISEFILTDIDHFLKNNNVNFTRYADDLRIFATNKKEAYKILQELTKYLYMHHKLSLSSSKTYIKKSFDFLSEVLDPELEANKKRQEWHDILGTSIFDMYGLSEEEQIENEKEQKKLVNSLVFDDMLNFLLESEEKFDLGIARHLFGKIKVVKDNELTLKIINNMEKLLPAIKNVTLYLIEAIESDFVSEHEETIILKINELRDYKIPFVNLWLDYMLLKNKHLLELKLTNQVFKKFGGISFKRKSFLMALFKKKFSYIREQKELSFSLDPWSLRALIYVTQLLPIEERVWLDKIDNKDLLNNCIKKYVRKQGSNYESEV